MRSGFLCGMPRALPPCTRRTPQTAARSGPGRGGDATAREGAMWCDVGRGAGGRGGSFTQASLFISLIVIGHGTPADMLERLPRGIPRLKSAAALYLRTFLPLNFAECNWQFEKVHQENLSHSAWHSEKSKWDVLGLWTLVMAARYNLPSAPFDIAESLFEKNHAVRYAVSYNFVNYGFLCACLL
jgi:hypothetical protein